MSIYDKIKDDLKTARLARASFNVTALSTILGEMSSVAVVSGDQKIVFDEAAIGVLKKSIKGLDEMLSYDPLNADASTEKTLLSSYLPKQLSYDELRYLVECLTATGMDFSSVMKFLKAEHAGLYDGKLAATIAKEVLA